MKEIIETRTLETILAELNDSVDKYNASGDAKERVTLAAEHKKLADDYNKLSLLTSYAEFMASENPVLALAKAYYYDSVGTKDASHEEVVDGVTIMTVTRSVNEGVKKLDVAKFIEWTAEHNKCVAAGKDWKVKVVAARNSIENEWKKFFATGKDSHSMSIGKTKKALQAMFDALVFIPSESGKNAIIANGDIAKWVLGFANDRKDSKADGVVAITGTVLSKAKWNTLLLDIMHKAVTGKTFDIIFGDEDTAAEEPASKEA